MILILCIMATMVQGQLPVKISPMTIPGTTVGCPSDDRRQASHSILQNATREIVQNFDTLISLISHICVPGEWRRVFYSIECHAVDLISHALVSGI